MSIKTQLCEQLFNITKQIDTFSGYNFTLDDIKDCVFIPKPEFGDYSFDIRKFMKRLGIKYDS